jgi:nucleoid DNA-binding protein
MAKAASSPAKKTSVKSPTKNEIFSNIAESTGVTKKQVAAVFEALSGEISRSMSSKGAGVFTIPGLIKISKKKVPARPAQKGVPNPFTGELRDLPAKPASVKIRVRALKSLRDMA